MFSEYSEFLNYFYNLRREGVKMGLEHTLELSEKIGNPHKGLKFIHIAGTNGKGSCSALIESVLRTSGKKVGLFTSPHLINFNERIRVDGIPIKNFDIISFIEKNKYFIENIKSTFFEVSTVMALDYFSKKKVDVAIIETGLGGRLDSTNIIEPSLSIITEISLDHLDILGDTILKIAKEKSGIIKEKTPVVISRQSKEVTELFSRKAIEKSSHLIEVLEVLNVKVSQKGTGFTYRGEDYITSLIGDHQAYNASLVIESINIYDSSIQKKVIKKGLKNTFWPGRIQKIYKNIFFDVAHNKTSIKSLISTMGTLFPNLPLYGLFCLKGDKDIELIAEEMSKVFDQLFICDDKNKLLLKKEILSKKLINHNVENKITRSIEAGIGKLRYLVTKKGVGIVFGSHYIAKDILRRSEISFIR